MTSGYVLDSSYANTFFQELSPAWLNYTRAVNGIPGRRLDRPFTYLELGAGLGHSCVVNAGAFPYGEFYACDLNPAHVSAGRAHADALGLSNFTFHEASFEQLRSLDLPGFDFIVLHGVYSWVDAKARADVLEILRTKLNPGGLVYVSYNCMPGWASEMPVRRLLVELAASGTGDSADKMKHAAEVLKRLSDRKLRFFDANPEAVQAVEAYGRVPPNYLAHEFFNAAWEPFYSIDVATELAEAQLTFVGSATLPDNYPALIIDEASVEALKGLATPREVHLAMDFATNRRFRRDVFIRTDTPRSPDDAARALQETVIGCVAEPATLTNRIRVPRGQITFQADFIDALKSLLRDGSVTLGAAVNALAQSGGSSARNPSDIVRNLMYLVAGGALMPFAQEFRQRMPDEVRKPASPLVEHSLADIIRSAAPRAIPSERLGNGVMVRPEEALAIIELLSGTAPESITSAPREVIQRVVTQVLPSLVRLGLVN